MHVREILSIIGCESAEHCFVQGRYERICKHDSETHRYAIHHGNLMMAESHLMLCKLMLLAMLFAVLIVKVTEEVFALY